VGRCHCGKRVVLADESCSYRECSIDGERPTEVKMPWTV
jgi:hypothetical protein